jgi:ADP-heptose:LPS heptosyltransferase
LDILFITSTRIGDAILSTGLVGALLDRHAGARITIACGPAAAPLFAELPGLRRIIVMRKRPFGRHWAGLWRRCVGRRWDLVVDLRRSAIAWCLLARQRRILPKSTEAIHRVELLGRTLGLSPAPAPRLWTGPDQAAAARLLPRDRPALVLAPTANWAGKAWPAERFAELARRLTAPGAPLAGAAVAVSGGPGEAALAGPVLSALPARQGIDLVGLDLLTSYAVFERAALFVGNDSGLMHLAAAAGTPTLGLFGPTREAHYAPWGPLCAVQRTPESVEQLIGVPGYDRRTTGSLLTSLGVDLVERAALDLYRRSRAAEARPVASR